MTEMILGIGNILNGDDGIGIYIARELQVRLKGTAGTVVLDCGTTPENHTSAIRKQRPDRVILIDAADMDLPPGSYRLVPPEEAGVLQVTTHSISLSLLAGYLGQSAGEVLLVGIQPGAMETGTTLSAAVQAGGDEVVALIAGGRVDEIKPLEL